jgi:Ion channel
MAPAGVRAGMRARTHDGRMRERPPAWIPVRRVARRAASHDAAAMSSEPPTAGRGRRIEQHRYGLLLLCALASLAVQGMASPSDLQQLVVTALATASVLLALRAADLAPRFAGPAVGIAVTVLAVTVVRAVFGGIGDGAVRAMNAALVAIGPPAIAVGVVHDLRATRQVRIQTVMGALSFYVLVGMLFAFTYLAIEELTGDPFFANGETATPSLCLYFSFITLTTVGYGDLVARTDVGHTLAVFEALLGQIYLVTVVALIVSQFGRSTRRERSPQEM